MSNLTRTADYLSDSLEQLGFVIMSKRAGKGLPLVAFRLSTKEPERHFDEFALAHALRARGWVVPAYTMAPNTNKMKMLRVVVREDFSRSRCDMLLNDIKLCMGVLEESDRESIKRQEEYIKAHMTSSGRHQRTKHKSHHYKVRSISFPNGPSPSMPLMLIAHCVEREPFSPSQDWQDTCRMLDYVDHFMCQWD